MLTRPSIALEIILNEVCSLPEESIFLPKALGRYLSREIFAPLSLPPFDNSAMDGFAVHASDVRSASPSSPISLKVIDTLVAGDLCASSRRLKLGEAVRIMTGAPMPTGADTVVPFEESEEKEGYCILRSPVSVGRHVRKKGEDIQDGTCALKKGVRLTPRNMALLAALGFDQAPVTRLPQVALFSTGNELKTLGSVLEPGQIYDSNGPTLSLALQELGMEATLLPTPQDTLQDLLDKFQKASASDVILSMGAVSAGDFDLVPQALEKLGAKILFHKLAIKPGKPLLFARWEHRFIFCLPGNPVSALIVFDRFVRPALLKMMGASNLFRRRYTATVSQEIKATQGKEDYLRADVEWKNGSFITKLAGSQGSAHLVPLAKSNALLVIPESQTQVMEGEQVEFEFWEDMP